MSETKTPFITFCSNNIRVLVRLFIELYGILSHCSRFVFSFVADVYMIRATRSQFR